MGSWIPDQVGDDGGGSGMTAQTSFPCTRESRGHGSPIEPGMTEGVSGMMVHYVIPVKTGIQGPWIPDRVGDDGGGIGADGWGRDGDVNCGFMKNIQL